MSLARHTDDRAGAVRRADAYSPFLRDALRAWPDIADRFLGEGPEAAAAASLAIDRDDLETALRARRQALALAVALGDLAGELSLERVTQLLSGFADSAIEEALGLAIAERYPDSEPVGFAVVALGKLGSVELNYSSDVDLSLLFDPATLPRRAREDAGEAAVRIGRRLIEILQRRTEAGYVERVDLRLRPSPEVTPIALPVDAAISHYESSALPWERAAFIRARVVAGDYAVGSRFIEAIEPFVWRRSVDFGVIEDVRQISVRIRDHFAQNAHIGPGFDLKRGRGGIREVEFFVQIQQMIHGGRDLSVRRPATLDAIAALQEAGHLDAGTARSLADAYRLLRTIEHRVQMVDDAQTHLLPAQTKALDNVAQLHGLTDGAALVGLLRPHVEAAGLLFDGLMPGERGILSNDPEILREELDALGFADPAAAAKHVGEWRSGKARALRSPAAQAAFEAMLPGLMRAIAAGADPAHSLNRFADIVERLPSGVNLFRLLEARPQLAETFALILTHAPALSEQLARRPVLFDGLIDRSSFAEPLDAATTAQRLIDAARGRPLDQSVDPLRRMIGERRFALGVQLIAGHRDPITIAEGYSDLAEGAIIAMTELTAREFERRHGIIPGGELIVLALGRLGGRALTHASDLDLIYLFDAPDGAMSDGEKSLSATDYYNRLASRVSAALAIPTAAGPLYEVDTRLRPQGAQGMLAVALDAFEQYQRREAWTWEHMALCRARPLTGSAAARKKVAELVGAVLKDVGDTAKVRADAAKMRADMAHHKPPAGPLDVKLGPGGLVDLEFAVHTLQLTSHVGLDPRLEVAIAALVKAGLIDDAADPDLRLLSRILVVSRLVAPVTMEPAEQSRALVARLCGHEDWDLLLEAVGGARHRIGERWAQVKDGQ
ncbi:MAG: bifunctional [glutamate--ammonia ligase]-adenylyl-L-tyrosine phosphorylase/[glutamate--ammonia-ligase] adenylyltransferase [Sphingomicrobium sp.]